MLDKKEKNVMMTKEENLMGIMMMKVVVLQERQRTSRMVLFFPGTIVLMGT